MPLTAQLEQKKLKCHGCWSSRSNIQTHTCPLASSRRVALDQCMLGLRTSTPLNCSAAWTLAIVEFAATIYGDAKSLLGDGVGHLILFNVEKFQRFKRPIGRLTCLTAALHFITISLHGLRQLFHQSFAAPLPRRSLTLLLITSVPARR